MRATLKAKVRARNKAIKFQHSAGKRYIYDYTVMLERRMDSVARNTNIARWFDLASNQLAQAADKGDTRYSLTGIPALEAESNKAIAELESLRRHMGEKAAGFAGHFSEAKKRVEMAKTKAQLCFETYWREHSDVPIRSDARGLHWDWSD